MSQDERKTLNQDDFFLRQALQLDADYVYTEDGLTNEKALDQAIDLLHYRMQGHQGLGHTISLHIGYNEPSESYRTSAFREKSMAIQKNGQMRLEQKKLAMTRLNLHWTKKNQATEFHAKLST